jgi:hypothetical protein
MIEMADYDISDYYVDDAGTRGKRGFLLHAP